MIRQFVLGLAFLGAQSAAAQPLPPVVAIGDLLADTDGDRVPDALGMPVTVEGRASADQGAFGPKGPSFYIESANGGLAVGLSDQTTASVSAGDSVRATGVFSFVDGVAVLTEATAQVLSSTSRPVAPSPYNASDPERAEGRLVEVEGIVVGQSQVAAGQSLSLTLDDRSLLVAFIYAGSPDPPSIDAYAPGDRVRIVGVAGQYDRVAPYEESYQIYPRGAGDIQRAGIPLAMYRRGGLVALALLGLALAWGATLRRQVQRRVDDLCRSEDRYRSVVSLARDAITIHDLRGGHIELNRAAREAIGCGPDDTPPPLFDVIVPEDHAAVRRHIARLQKKGTSRAELRLLGASGPRVFEFDSQLITLEGEPCILSLARDIEVRLEYERGLIEAREQAEEMARVKSAFLASMSHEIRTPLTAVIGFADLLRYEVADDQLDLVLAIEAGGTRLLNTLNSVLDLAQIDSGGQTVQLRTIDLVEHIHRSMDVLRPMAHGQGLLLQFDSPADSLLAQADPGAFDRILTNLVGNAVKFTDEGSVTVSLRTDGDTLELAVTDTGIGIDAEFLPDLFSEFRQESEGHARSHEGSGLGLAITERLVRLMDGTIEVASEKGVGTTFTVQIPHILPEADTTDAVGTMLVSNDPVHQPVAEGPTLADLLG